MALEPLTLWLLVIKVMLYATTLLASGISLHINFRIIEAEGRRRAMIYAGSFALAVFFFTVARLLVVTAQLGGGIETAFDPASFAWTWRAHGLAALAAFAGAGAIIIAIPMRMALVAGVGAIGLAFSFALTGHSHALDNPGLVPWGVAFHVVIAGFWVAAPLTLWPRKDLSDIDLVARLKRFSAIALIVVPLLFALGLWLAWRLAGGVAPLLTSLYGQVLLMKLGVASIALGLGAFNTSTMIPAIGANQTRGRGLLKRALGGEALAFCVALVLVGWATTMLGPSS